MTGRSDLGVLTTVSRVGRLAMKAVKAIADIDILYGI